MGKNAKSIHIAVQRQKIILIILNRESKENLMLSFCILVKKTISIINANVLSIEIDDDKKNDHQITNENVADIPDVDILPISAENLPTILCGNMKYN